MSLAGSYLRLVGLAFIATALGGAAYAAEKTAAADTTASATGSPPSVSLEPFFKLADYGGLRLSPSGRYIAALVPIGGRRRLAVLDLEGGQGRPIASVEDQDIVSVDWVNDQRLVFSHVDLHEAPGMRRAGATYAINRDGTDPRRLAVGGVFWYRTLRDGSNDIIALMNGMNRRQLDVYRVDTVTGRETLKSLDRPGDVDNWVIDRDGAARAAVSVEKATRWTVWWRPTADAKWIELYSYGLQGPRTVPVGFDGDGSLIVASNEGRDTFALYRYDTQRKALGELLAAHPRADLLGGLIYDRRKKRVVGIAYNAEEPGSAWFDEDYARLQAAIDKALPNHRNVMSRGDAPRALIYSYSDTGPGRYYLLNLDTRKLEAFVVARKSVDPERMPHRKFLRYGARDGLEIPAYLTLPRDKPAQGLPLVMIVHGGPWVRGSAWGWEPEAAYLASLGYAVLEPQFRGSTGFGRTLYEASFKQWGRAMQDDLDDGMDYLAQQGIVDPHRACIMGASYGGYAVMMGLARDPARWRCGIDIVGVTDINMMFDITWSDMINSDFIKYSAREMIGDPDRDADALKQVSPLQNASRIRAPVLMAYGGLDRRVPLVHGERMRDALEKQGTPVEWVVYNDEGHGFASEADRYDFYARVEKFLEKNLRNGDAVRLGDRR